MTDRRTIIRRRWYWTVAAILVALLIRYAIDNDGFRCAICGLVILCWFALYRTLVEDGLQ